MFNQTMVQPSGTFGNLSDRHHAIDLSQTQNIPSHKLINGQMQAQQHTIHHNFDFGESLRVPASTKNQTNSGKQAYQQQQEGKNNSFFSNAQLRDFMTNMNNVTQTFTKPFFQNNITTQPGSTKGNKSTNTSAKRKPSQQGVPQLDMKKVSMKQIQKIMHQQLASRRDPYQQDPQPTSQSSNEHLEKTPQNQLTNIADSALYKNLTQKLIREQQQYNAVPTGISQKQLLGGGSMMNNNSSTSSKFNLKKMPTPSNKALNTSGIQQQQQQDIRYFSNGKTGPQLGPQSIPISSTHKGGQKSFNLDLRPAPQTSKNNAKKKLNLTGTLPKGLLSPTNNGYKHKHADYFESTNVVPTDKSTMGSKTNSQVFSQQAKPSHQQQQQPQQMMNVEYMLYQQQIDHFNQMIINIDSGPCKHQPSGSELRLNQTGKMAPSHNQGPSNVSHSDLPPQPSSYPPSQAVSKPGLQQRKAFHQKNSTLPNAAVLLLQEIGADLHDFQDDQDQGVVQEAKGQSLGTTPRILKQKSMVAGQKSQGVSNITIRKKTSGNSNKTHLKKNIHIQLELSDTEQEEEGPGDVKLRSQKIADLQKILASSQTGISGSLNPGKKGITPQLSPKANATQPVAFAKFSAPMAADQPMKQPSLPRRKSDPSTLSKPNSRHSPSPSEVLFPITPARALKLFINQMTDFEKGEILDYKQVFFLGIGSKKIKGSPLHSYNQGYDDERGDYKVVIKDHIGYRWEVLEFLGKGSFGQALKCFDHKTKEIVAVKLIRNKKKFQHQAGVELKILQHLKVNDPEDQYNIIRIKDHLVFRKHLVISFELFSINLYEFIKNNNFQGVSLSLIRRFAIQMLQALKFLNEEQVIHCDLKPENILLKSPDKSGIKIIDFGSSCFQDERIYTYIQSRFYRAPEIILGIPYTPAIDMWSFGCILIELFTGYPIFPGESEQEQLALIMEVLDVPPQIVLDQSTRKKLFFDEETDDPILNPNSRGKVRMPNTKSLQNILRCQSPSFIDFIVRCLDWNPLTRMTAFEALMHDWIIEGLPPKVLMHHKRMLGLIPVEATPQIEPINFYKAHPQTTKASNQAKLNKTCLISEAFQAAKITNSGNVTNRGKSLNRTGMVVVDENEDMTDIDNCFLMNAKAKPQKVPQKKERYQDHNEDDDYDEVQKSKTTNISDLLYQMKKGRKQRDESEPPMGVKQKMKIFENTHDLSKLKKNSFFSQNNADDQIFSNEEDIDEDDDNEAGFLPFDERDQQDTQNTGHQGKKNQLPFSFLMHHYMKTNQGASVAASNPAVGFYKPGGKDVKLNNFMVGASAGNNQTQKPVQKKGFINMSSNV